MALDAKGELSADSTQRLEQFCQMWRDAGWSLDRLDTVANWLRDIRRGAAHQLNQVDHTSADDLLSDVPACCQDMGPQWNQPGQVAGIQKIITTLRDSFTTAEAVLRV